MAEETTNTIEGQETQVTDPADTTEYTLHQQELDQERANARRAREQLSAVSELYESEHERLESLEKELDELKSANRQERERLEAAQQEEQDKLDDMDPELIGDERVIKNIQNLQNQLRKQMEVSKRNEEALQKRIDDLSKKAAQYETERAEMQRKTEHEKSVESVLTRVEASLKRHNVTTPGQYRTEAMKIADELVDKGVRKKPGNIIEAVELMEECYLKVISQHQKKKNVVSVDGGRSGVTAGVKTSPNIKSGSLSDVKAQMLKDKSWRKD